jgi:hypothetical protein
MRHKFGYDLGKIRTYSVLFTAIGVETQALHPFGSQDRLFTLRSLAHILNNTRSFFFNICVKSIAL